MLDMADVERLALALPQTQAQAEGEARTFTVAGKGFCWTYRQRVDPKKPRQPRPDVVSVRCPLERKDMLIEAAPEIYFDDDHYRGYPAVLVRLAAVGEAELAALLRDAWRLKAPRRLLKAAAP